MTDIIFNIIDILAEDFEDDDNDKAYLIKLFGRTQNGKTVSVNLLDYTPHFYLKLPFQLDPVKLNAFRQYLKTQYRDGFTDCKMTTKKDFWGFTNNETFPFVQLLFKSRAAMKRAVTAFSRRVTIPGVFLKPTDLKLYESNIEPFLRMFHKRDVDPCGWACVPAGKYRPNLGTHATTCDIDVSTKWTHLMPVAMDGIAPFKIASFDIECVSFDGGFPVARRDYKNIVINFLDAVSDPNKDFVSYFDSMFKANKLVLKKRQGGVPEIDVVTCLKHHREEVSNILDMKMSYDEMGNRQLHNEPHGDKDIKILSLARKLRSMFPHMEGDPIIQIGTTTHCYGEKEASEKFVFVLGSCDPIEGAEVFTFETERALLVAWTKFVRDRVDPDIMLGYNIYGFDFEYMYDRACELGCDVEFRTLGRIRNKVCEYRSKMLSSSALGDNLLKYIEIEGRVVIDIMKVVQRDHKLDSYKLDNVAHHFTGDKKNDVSPQDIFRLHRGDATDRKKVAEYCIQDCALLNKLCAKLEIVANNVGMANVCCVPLNWILMRGQGVKIFSLVSKQCKQDDYLIPVVKGFYGTAAEEGYEGAIVLNPEPGIYMDPITVLDYASLYPSSMISENISHDTIVMDKKFDNLPGVEYVNVVYDEFTGTGDKKFKCGERTCRYAQSHKGVLPRILQHLLQQRKTTRKKMTWKAYTLKAGFVVSGLPVSDEGGFITLHDGTQIQREDILDVKDHYDEFQKGVLDGLQNAYKVTANSLYGQVGARTSPIYMKDLAASTTATGRNMILKAKKYIEETLNGKVIYGDTDSIFIQCPKTDGTDVRACVKAAIDYGIAAQNGFKPHLKPPHDCEWEKVFFPFIIFSKKRYIGNVYDNPDHPDKFKMKCMGVVLKRRDNAPIVKTVYGGCIDILLNNHDIPAATTFLRDSLQKLIDGSYPIEELIISKSLRANYKDPERIAHKVLAERIGERDPGNKPQVNDRIQYVYVVTEDKKALQGERIETPDYIKKMGLDPDYKFYISNQIMKPVIQIFGLEVEKIPGYDKAPDYWHKMRLQLQATLEGDKLEDKLLALRENEAQRLLFEPVLIQLGDKPKRRQGLKEEKEVKPAKKRATKKAA